VKEEGKSGRFQVAVDGPSGAGKSTAARELAARLGFEYIDTGAMYRAVAYKILTRAIDPENDEKLAQMLSETSVDFAAGKIWLDGGDVSDRIRTDAVAKMASACSARFAVREKLVALQRAMGARKSVVMDGRDIGSNVFPNARYKFFLTATPEERARRRCRELRAKGEDVTQAGVLADIRRRDENDAGRALNPLTRTADAVEIDATGLSAAAVVETMLARILAAEAGRAQEGGAEEIPVRS
jgi:cytidylate kinase